MSRAKQVSIATFESEVLESSLRGEVVAQSAGTPSESELSEVVQQMVDFS